MATTRKTTKRPAPTVPVGGRVPEECTGCFIQDGLGYNPHLQLCHKFYHCAKENDNVIKYTHTCPFGQFWSQKALSCVDPKVAKCDKDPCKQKDHVGMRYEMAGICSGYWECANEEGKIFSKAMCCEDGHVYETISANCVPGTCNNTMCGVPKPKYLPFVCPYKAVPGDVTKFRSSISWGLMSYDLPCSPGTIFDPDRCTCVNENIVTVPTECKPEIHMKFDGNFLDDAGVDNEKAVVRVTLMNSDPSPAGGSYAYFNGSSYINLYSLANIYYGRTVAIHFWMRSLPGTPDEPETVITNCLMSTGSESNQCLYSDCNPSIQIELSNLTSTLNHKLVMEDGDTHILKSNINNDEWVEVWYVYDGTRSQEFVTGTKSTEDHVITTGIVGQRQSGLVIGRPVTNAFNNYFKGDLDEFEFYRCIPKKAKDALKNIK
ncbi:hypothetical protein CHS0354_025172 [Potamilus streckersoni]|nr:hypothetical protein CHS0354_025172 [Potamilus streckersoni]